jgi:hypothetical protein
MPRSVWLNGHLELGKAYFENWFANINNGEGSQSTSRPLLAYRHIFRWSLFSLGGRWRSFKETGWPHCKYEAIGGQPEVILHTKRNVVLLTHNQDPDFTPRRWGTYGLVFDVDGIVNNHMDAGRNCRVEKMIVEKAWSTVHAFVTADQLVRKAKAR